MKRYLIPAAAAAMVGFAPSTHAYTCDMCVVSAVQLASTAVTTAITAMSGTLQYSLESINTNLSNVGSKISDSVIQASNQQREMQIETQRKAEKERVERETEAPIDPCGNSGGNYAGQAKTASGSKSSSYKRGGGGASVSSPVLNKALNDPIPSPEVARRQSTAIHAAKYCSAIEVRLGYPGCAPSSMPDADANIESVLTGAGTQGKDPELSFTSEQEEAARAYARLSLDPHPPQNISKSEAATEQGKLYIAMQKMYQANISSAEKAQFDAIASRTPFAGSSQLVSEIKKSTHAAAYFLLTASKHAKAGNMSDAELMDFEAGRRYRNVFWYIAMLGEADPVKLQREQIMMSAYANEVSYRQMRELERLNISIGQLLASHVRSEMRPAIESQLLRVQSTNSR